MKFKILSPNVSELGDGITVKRTLPHKSKHSVGPFIFWDHFGPIEMKTGKELVVRAHPHIGLATITYLFSGEILHRDSLGNEQVIRPGEMNWMTAGKGIVHSERSQKNNTFSTLEGIQLWLGLPKEHEDVGPSFHHFMKTDLPKIEGEGYVLDLIAGEAFGRKSPIPTYSSLFYMSGAFQKGSVLHLDIHAQNEEAAVYVIEGEICIDGEYVKPSQMGVFESSDSMSFSATVDTKLMIFGGENFPERRYKWWNFVSHSKGKIETAKADWKNKRFQPVIHETEFIPLPED